MGGENKCLIRYENNIYDLLRISNEIKADKRLNVNLFKMHTVACPGSQTSNYRNKCRVWGANTEEVAEDLSQKGRGGVIFCASDHDDPSPCNERPL